MSLPLWSKCSTPFPLNPEPIIPTWWNPGLYIKPTDVTFEAGFSGSPGSITFGGALINELNESGMEAVQGLKYVILMGRFETNSSTRSFEKIGAILDAFAALTPQRRLILSIAQREFQSSANGISRLLPADMQTQQGLYNWNGTNVREYKYAWPFISSVDSGQYGHNMKLWNSTDGTTVRNRLKAFVTALTVYIAAHPNGHLVEHLSETESVIGNPVVPNFSTVEPSSARGSQTFTNKSEYSNYINAATIAIGKYYMQGLNFINSFVTSQAPQLPGLKMGLSTPDHHAGSNIATVMRYFKTGSNSLDGQIPLAAECQEDSFESTTGLQQPINYNYPAPLAQYNRAVTIGNTHFVISRVTVGSSSVPGGTHNYWEGSANYPGGMKAFIKTHPAIQDDPLRAGGMVSTLPTCFND